jgi:hypothetical protein
VADTLEDIMKKLLLILSITGFSVTLVSVTASTEANAQTFVNGRPATTAEMHHLQVQGFGAGNWRTDGWGISSVPNHQARVTALAPKCHYVLDVPLDCEVVVASR